MSLEIQDGGEHQVPINALPKTAIQALYHAVTGKTENLARPFFGDVIIDGDDIEQLLVLISEQISHYELLAEPTVTIVVKDSQSRAATYSSWPRYRELRVSTNEVTSEVLIKVEFVMTLPGTQSTQRCIISLTLDSSLPVLCNPQLKKGLQEEFAYFVHSRGGWNALNVSIDFVDFLVAKNFMAHIEEWFKGLKHTIKPKMNSILLDSRGIIRLIILQAGRIGLATFLFSYIYFSPSTITLNEAVGLAAAGLMLMALINIIQHKVSVVISRRIITNFISGVVILTAVDKKRYDEQVSGLNSPLNSAIAVIFTIALSVSINIFSSYLYAWLGFK